MQCTSLVQDCINRRWDEDKSFENIFFMEEKVKSLIDALNIFTYPNLLKVAKKRCNKAKQFINQTNRRINETKVFYLMNNT